MNRTEARSLWARIARGDLESDDPYLGPFDLHAWVREVAQEVLKADELTGRSSADRAYALVSALGLDGKQDAYAELRSMIAEASMFDDVSTDSATAQKSHRQTVRELVATARERGLLTGVYADPFDDKKACDLVHDILAGKR